MDDVSFYREPLKVKSMGPIIGLEVGEGLADQEARTGLGDMGQLTMADNMSFGITLG